jgi:hypothetical protein
LTKLKILSRIIAVSIIQNVEENAMKIVFDFSNQRISIEGDGPQLLNLLGMVREIAPKLSHIEISTNNTLPAKISNNGVSTNATTTDNNPAPSDSQTLKQFVRQLNFKNLSERIAAIAYYYKRYENRDIFSPKDMDSWFTFAAFQKPSQMAVALSDASRKLGYVESTGYTKWKLSTQGENLITGKLNQVVEQ